jgi:hypothetical protein
MICRGRQRHSSQDEEASITSTVGLPLGSRPCLADIMNQLTSSTISINNRYLSQMRTNGCKSYKGVSGINSKRNHFWLLRNQHKQWSFSRQTTQRVASPRAHWTTQSAKRWMAEPIRNKSSCSEEVKLTAVTPSKTIILLCHRKWLKKLLTRCKTVSLK